MPRSGSTWSYTVCRMLLAKHYGADAVEAVYREGQNADDYATTLNGSAKAHVVNLHYPGPTAMQLVADKQALNVYTLRDPFDAIASFKEVFGESVRSAAQRVKRSLVAAERFHREIGRVGTRTLRDALRLCLVADREIKGGGARDPAHAFERLIHRLGRDVRSGA